MASLEDSGLGALRVSLDLLPAFFEEIVGLLDADCEDPVPCTDQPPVVAPLIDFPANISVCLKLLKSGEATLKAFLFDRCEAFHAESEFDRECILWNLHRATHRLIHREIQDICEQSLRPVTEIHGRDAAPQRQEIPAAGAMISQT